MDKQNGIAIFDHDQLKSVNQAVTLAEELVSNHYKMSSNEWLRPRFDVKTGVELGPEEIDEKAFAQIVRYQGTPKGATFGSESYDLYRICIQDHNILKALRRNPLLSLTPFCVYLVIHELVHIVRFRKFLQNFDASTNEKQAEESRVHALTRDIVTNVQLPDMEPVLAFSKRWG